MPAKKGQIVEYHPGPHAYASRAPFAAIVADVNGPTVNLTVFEPDGGHTAVRAVVFADSPEDNAGRPLATPQAQDSPPNQPAPPVQPADASSPTPQQHAE